MVGLVHVCAARTGVAMWRLRRHLCGLVFVAVALCLFYFQLAADGSVAVAHQEAAPLRRDIAADTLHGVAAATAVSSADTANKMKPERVKFVPNTQAQLDEKQRMLNKQNSNHENTNDNQNILRDDPQKKDMNDYPDHNKVDIQTVDRKTEIQSAMDQLHVNNVPVDGQPIQHTAPPAAVVLPMDEGFGSPWGGGYKYNPYGEPVYGKTDRPNYIPKHRVIHFDLKGAPPRMSVMLTLIPWLATHGATAILLEYEDVFPWHGDVAETAAINHYTPSEIQELISVCDKHKIEVIPLVQTFGHMEFALKLKKFAHLREVPELPQALCPSRDESLKLIYELIDQIMNLHPNSRYLHIGCDEVYHMGECELCRQVARENIFLQHVTTVARYVRTKYGVTVLIWDDMLRHVSDISMRDYHLGELVEPMVWVYAEDIYRFVQPSIWTKYSQVFSTVWAASAFKGAFGEQMTVPNVRRHVDNHMNWLDVMATESPKFSGGFRGIVLTGWQRFDHFAVLCELFPAAMPSLAVNLISTSRGYFNSSIQTELYTALNCVQTPKYQSWINLDSDPFLWDKISWCFFPGNLAFKLTSRLDSTRRDVDAYVERVTRSRAWITDYNRRHNFSSPMRVDEDIEELPGRLHSITILIKTAREGLIEWFDEWTVGEWVEQHIWPMLNKIETLQRESESMKKVKYWPARPLPLLPQLAQYGIAEPTSKGNAANDNDISRSRSKNVRPT